MGLDQRTIIAVFLVSIRKSVDSGVSFCVMEFFIVIHIWASYVIALAEPGRCQGGAMAPLTVQNFYYNIDKMGKMINFMEIKIPPPPQGF